jgi:nitrate reductase gamma subunit
MRTAAPPPSIEQTVSLRAPERIWHPPISRSRFGDIIIIVFLLAQCLDGVFTYIGVLTYGTAIEANPLMTALMSVVGHAPALAGSKTVAAGLGICLHVRQVHGAVALLALFYVIVAIVPWMTILFF